MEICNAQLSFVVQIHFKGVNFSPNFFRTYYSLLVRDREEVFRKKLLLFISSVYKTNKIIIVNNIFKFLNKHFFIIFFYSLIVKFQSFLVNI